MIRALLCIIVAFVAIDASRHPLYYDYQAYPKYTFEYAVHDPHTKDIKKQWETRDGDKVKGSYNLVEPDGTLRIVDYQADDHNGFTAIVRRQGQAQHPQVYYHGQRSAIQDPIYGTYAANFYGQGYGGYLG